MANQILRNIVWGSLAWTGLLASVATACGDDAAPAPATAPPDASAGTGGAGGSQAGTGGRPDASSGGSAGSTGASGTTSDGGGAAGSAGSSSAGTSGVDGGSDAGGGSGGDAGVGEGGAPVTVGTTGGTLSDPSGTIAITIPAGALLGDTTFTLTPVSAIPNLSSDHALVAGTVFRVDWSGAGFRAPGTVSIRFDTQLPQAPADETLTQNSPLGAAGLQCAQYLEVCGYDTCGFSVCELDGGGTGGTGGTSGGSRRGSATVGQVTPAPAVTPGIWSQPQETGVTQGENARFDVTVTGLAPSSYQWKRNGIDIPYDPTNPKYSYFGCSPGAQSCDLLVNAVDLGDEGAKFSVVVKYPPFGSITSVEVPLKVCPLGPSLTFTDFVLPTAGDVRGITGGPDGNVWFTQSTASRVGKITPTGTVTQFTVPHRPHAIASGPDGNLWFTVEYSGFVAVGRITPSGTVTEFTVADSFYPGGMTRGPDGNLWFTDLSPPGTPHSSIIGRVTPTGTITTFPVTGATRMPSIVTGPDNNLWFSAGFGVGKSTASGAITRIDIATLLAGPIVLGPDNNLWFGATVGVLKPGGVSNGTGAAAIFQITPTGAVTKFPVCGAPGSMAVGADGNLWFTYISGLGRITPQGTVTNFAAAPFLGSIGAGPDGNLWFGNGNAAISRFTPP